MRYAVRVVVEEDSDAVLNCSLSTKEDLTGKYFDWRKDGQKEVFQYDAGVHYNNGLQGQDEQFKGRVSFFQDQLQNGNASIKITRTKMADSGTYSCDFPRHQPRQTSIIELVVEQVLKDRAGENIPGAAPEPVIKILKMTKNWILLQCEAHGVSPLTVEWKNAAGNILKSESTPKSETGSPSSITLNIAVTKTDNYSCVATQETLSHQVAAVIPVYIEAVRVVVEEDSDAVLPCWIRTKEDISGKLLVWKKDGQKQVFTHDTSDKFPNRDQDDQFKGRVSVFQDQLENGDASIKITRTKMADSGNYSCDFPRHQQRQTSIIELVVGLAPKPDIDTLADTRYWRLLQCEAHGDPRPTIKWQDSDDNTLPAEEPQISDRGGRFYITVKVNVTKTNNYRCVATQETLSHQVAAVIPVSLAVRVVVEQDSDAVLPCLISTEENLEGKFFDWRKNGQKEVFMYDAGIHYNNGLPGQDDQFKGRVSHFQDQLQNGDASIKIIRTKMADSGNYSCDFPRHQPSQTSIIELVVDPVLRERLGENIPGAALEPNIKILDETNHWRLLQCEAHGDPLPTLEWKDSDNNTLPADTPQISDRGGRFYITVNVTVTKTDNYSCVATQEKFSHQIPAVTSVRLTARVTVVVKEDSDAVLPCLISPKEDITENAFDWKKDGQDVFFRNPIGHTTQGPDFTDRVSHFQDQLQNGDASIKIRKTKKTDSGNYSCIFPHLQSQTSIIELVVDPVLRDRTGEHIPARVRVVVEEGSDAVLPCLISTKEDISYQVFDWKKDGQKKKEVFLYDAGVHSINGLPGQDEQFKGRVSFFQDQLENGNASIKITRTKMADSGNYSCDFPRHQPRQTSIIELVVAKVRVLVEEDSDAVLPCLISPKEDITRKAFDWKKDGQDVFFNDPAGRTTQGRDFTGRVSRFEDQLQNGNASIKITRTKKTDSGNYSCIFPNLQSQTSIIELVVGASSKPYVRTVITDDGVILQCEVLGASPKPKVEWKDSSGNILQTEEPQVTESGGGYDIVLRAAVTKTDTFRCVVTQEEISHQTEAETYASVSVPPPEPGSNTGLIVAVVVLCLLLVAAVVYHFKDRIRQICALGSRRNTANGPTGAELSANPMIDHSERL